MKKPEYWYEEQIFRFLAFMPIETWQLLAIGTYWYEFSFEKTWTSYLLSGGLGCFIYIASSIGYYYLWTHVLGLSQPMAFGLFIPGTLGCIGTVIARWFRQVLDICFFDI